MKLIDKDAVEAEIEKLKGKVDDGSSYCNGWQHALRMLEIELNTIEMKEVDLEKEYKDYINCDNGHTIFEIVKHFFELGMRANNPITAADRGMAEEIIINLKRVEQDYCINLTKEMEWLRNQVKKGE